MSLPSVTNGKDVLKVWSWIKLGCPVLYKGKRLYVWREETSDCAPKEQILLLSDTPMLAPFMHRSNRDVHEANVIYVRLRDAEKELTTDLLE